MQMHSENKFRNCTVTPEPHLLIYLFGKTHFKK